MSKELELEEVAKQYRRGGYEVILRPRGVDLPPFLSEFEPDLIARKEGENVVVEVEAKADLTTDHRLGYLAALVNAQPDWRFDLVVTNHEIWPDEVPGDSTEPSISEIRSRAKTAEKLVSMGELEAALLVAWSAVEAAMREAARRQAIRLETRSAQFVLKTLYAEGVLSRSDYERLEEAMRVRNATAHGLKLPALPPEIPAFLIEAATRLLDAAPHTKRNRRHAGSPT